jgi:hypothetical protein
MIKFKVEMDDIVALNRHFVASSPVYRAIRKRSVVTCATVFTCLAVLQAFLHRSLFPLAIWFVVTIFFCLWIYTKSGRVSAKKISRIYSEDRDRLVLCEHEIEILPDGFVDKSPLGEQRTKFPAIVRLDETPSHVFIFTGSLQAHIIPKGKVSEGDLGAFVGQLKKERST